MAFAHTYQGCVVGSQALEERLRLVRAQRNKLLSAFENLQGSGGLSHAKNELRCAEHDCIGNNIVLLCIRAMPGAMRARKAWSDLDAELDSSWALAVLTFLMLPLRKLCSNTDIDLLVLVLKVLNVSSQQPLQRAENLVQCKLHKSLL